MTKAFILLLSKNRETDRQAKLETAFTLGFREPCDGRSHGCRRVLKQSRPALHYFCPTKILHAKGPKGFDLESFPQDFRPSPHYLLNLSYQLRKLGCSEHPQ